MLSTLFFFDIEIIIYRDDLNHVTVSGNKLHKLSPNIKLAKARGCTQMLSFGGPYSNHLHALAWACKESGLESIGVVRGELQARLTPTLKDCEKWGMQLFPWSRQVYREFQERLTFYSEPCLASELSLASVFDELQNQEKTLVIPEGGSNTAAIESLTKAYRDVFKKVECQGVTHVICATGTGATVAGLLQAAPEDVDIIGMQAVAEGLATFERVQAWLGDDALKLTIEESHLGRFGKIPPSLITFIEQFEARYGIPLDPIYTGKAMLKLTEMIKVGHFNKTDKVLFIHTGGLQGKRS